MRLAGRHLSPELEYGTEPAIPGKYRYFKGNGVYRCVACGEPLFSSEHEYDSGGGWPSDWQPGSLTAVEF